MQLRIAKIKNMLAVFEMKLSRNLLIFLELSKAVLGRVDSIMLFFDASTLA